jgi:parvulin-like peptidyl-prolyl isomerase
MAVLILGCTKPAEEIKVVAMVNGEPITEDQLEHGLKKMAPQHSASPEAMNDDAMKKAVLETLITETLMLQGAREAGIELKEGELEAKLAFIRKQLGEEAFRAKLEAEGQDFDDYSDTLARTMLRQRFFDSLAPEESVTEEDVKKAYTESPVPFLHSARMKVRFIQTESFEQAEEIIKLLKKDGAEFDKVAEEVEAGGIAMVSGYGWTTPGMYSPEIAEGLKRLDSGGTGGPYEGKMGYFIFHVEEKTPERPKSFEEARSEIKRSLLDKKRRAAFAHWIAQKRSNSKIEQY